MNCQPEPTDTPGIFRCPVCGKQNPRPTVNGKPFIAECGKAVVRSPEEIAQFLERCEACEWHHEGQCYYDARPGRQRSEAVARLAREGRCLDPEQEQCQEA